MFCMMQKMNIRPILLILTSFYLLVVGVEGYCCS
jgi:hypothetical protein